MASKRSQRTHENAPPHRQMRPAIARKIAKAHRARIERRKAEQAADLAAVLESGIRIKGDTPTDREIRRARQKLARKKFAAANWLKLVYPSLVT